MDVTADLIPLEHIGNVGLAPRQWLATLATIRELPER